MKLISKLSSDEDIDKFVEEIVGDNRYEKCLLFSVIYFLIHYCPEAERDWAHVQRLIKTELDFERKITDLFKIMTMTAMIDPDSSAVYYYEQFATLSKKNKIIIVDSVLIYIETYQRLAITKLKSKMNVCVLKSSKTNSNFVQEKCPIINITYQLSGKEMRNFFKKTKCNNNEDDGTDEFFF